MREVSRMRFATAAALAFGIWAPFVGHAASHGEGGENLICTKTTAILGGGNGESRPEHLSYSEAHRLGASVDHPVVSQSISNGKVTMVIVDCVDAKGLDQADIEQLMRGQSCRYFGNTGKYECN